MADLGAVGGSVGPLNSIKRFSIRVVLPTATLSIMGNVFDDTGAGAARTVRAYRRSDGAFIGETASAAGTGAYTLACPPGEVQRIVLDDAAGTLYNDILDRITPA